MPFPSISGSHCSLFVMDPEKALPKILQILIFQRLQRFATIHKTDVSRIVETDWQTISNRQINQANNRIYNTVVKSLFSAKDLYFMVSSITVQQQFNRQINKQFNKQYDRQHNKQYNIQCNIEYNIQNNIQCNRQNNRQYNTNQDNKNIGIQWCKHEQDNKGII